MADASSEENNVTTEQETIKTEADLRLEELSKRLDALETENRELREANKGLWAAAHPVGEQQDASATEEPSKTDVDYVFEKLGVKI